MNTQIYNNGTYFFNIKTNNIEINSVINDDVISFTLCETLGEMTNGSLTMEDDNDVYSRIFVNGMQFSISFGYRSFNSFTGPYVTSFRKDIQCVVASPSGGGQSNGSKTFTVTFYSLDVADRKQYRVFTAEGNRANVISKLLLETGVELENQTISFKKGAYPVDAENQIRQYETSFALLSSLAREWGCLFWISTNAAGQRLGSFIDPTQIAQSGLQYIQQITPGIQPLELYFNAGPNSNVISYDWQQHIGDGANGDAINIRTDFKGRMIFDRVVVENDKFVAYTLNPDRIEKALDKAGNNGNYTEFVNNLLSQPEFNKTVKYYFDAAESSTAPQGFGFTITVQMVGDPFLLPYRQVSFKAGFPAALNAHGLSQDFFILKAAHSITKGGYMTSIEIVDSYTLAGSYLKIGAALQSGVG